MVLCAELLRKVKHFERASAVTKSSEIHDSKAPLKQTIKWQCNKVDRRSQRTLQKQIETEDWQEHLDRISYTVFHRDRARKEAEIQDTKARSR